jgi:hypothetical protein
MCDTSTVATRLLRRSDDDAMAIEDAALVAIIGPSDGRNGCPLWADNRREMKYALD